MTVYVVAYDLNKEVHRPNITAEIKTKPWARLSESSYAIDTSETPQQVFARLKPMIDENDNIYVIPLKKPWYGFGPKAVVDWLEARLTY